MKQHDIHADNHEHKFNWKSVGILDHRSYKNVKEFLGAYHLDQLAIDKHINMNLTYQPIKKTVSQPRSEKSTKEDSQYERKK